MRTGPALATADLLILNPSSWSAIRRQKDSMGRYYVAPDPSRDEVDSVWGVSVLETTVVPDGEGWLLDTTKFGRLAVRESLVVRIGYANDDLVRNILRYVAEERCVRADRGTPGRGLPPHHPAHNAPGRHQNSHPQKVTETRQAGALKQDPNTLAVAVRTVFPEDSQRAWGVMTVDRGGRHVSSDDVSHWPDLPVAGGPE